MAADLDALYRAHGPNAHPRAHRLADAEACVQEAFAAALARRALDVVRRERTLSTADADQLEAAVEDSRAGEVSKDGAGDLEDADVLGDRRQRHRERLRELPHADEEQHLAAGWHANYWEPLKKALA